MPNYVEKEALHKALCEWKTAADADEAAGKPRRPLPDSVGRVILEIVEGTARRPNFRQYTWLEEMKGDATIAAIRALNKFDPYRLGKSGVVNPFGFISRAVWRAFLNRIAFEKKTHARKIAMMLDPTVEHFEQGEEHYELDKSGLSDFYYGNKV